MVLDPGVNGSLCHVSNKPSNLDERFPFILDRRSDDANYHKTRRLARSHAVARGLGKIRKTQQELGHNFRVLTFDHEHQSQQPGRKRKRAKAELSDQRSSENASDPLEMLATESPKLQALYDQYKACQSREPLLSVADELVLRNFRPVLQNGVNDHALLSALMLAFVLAFTSNEHDKAYLKYRSEALNSIRQQISSTETAVSEPTIAAILLLAGVEARLGMPHQVQLHMGAIHRVLEICQTKGVYLSDGIKRAIFWSDLNASVTSGSCRVVSHTTFSELRWQRDPFARKFFVLPPGFQGVKHLLSDEFVEILEDISALQCIRDSTYFIKEDAMSMAHIDSHQASVQSRLLSLSSHSAVLECCYLAAYLCSTMLRCKIWRTSIIPSHLSLQLLHALKDAQDDPLWNDRPDMLAWLLHMGGAFAPDGPVRFNYLVLFHINRDTKLKGLYSNWTELLEILKQFVWSEKAFMSQVRGFWEEISKSIIF